MLNPIFSGKKNKKTSICVPLKYPFFNDKAYLYLLDYAVSGIGYRMGNQQEDDGGSMMSWNLFKYYQRKIEDMY